MAAFSAFESTFALFAERSYGFGASSIGVIVQGFLVGRVVKRIGEHHIVPASLAIVAIGLLMIPATRSVAALLVANGVMAVGMGFNNPSLMSLISRYSAAEDQGGVLGLTQSLNSLARIVGPLWGGFAFDHLGIGMPYITSAAVMGIAAALSIHALPWPARLTSA
ncbi:MAG: MFS transporter [Gammaproteobacteria bacterium]|nr:MFS transporter [Gammaproteobacteria bacterium]